nr:glycosyltransferase [Saccharopolyspora antimicrobica]
MGDGPSILDSVVEALGELPVTGVVAIGADRDPQHWRGTRADNVHLTSFVQQRLLLAATDVFITHAGFNGTREALGAGVPMVTIPMFAEQPANAARVTELGAGVRIELERAAPQAIRSAVQQVLTDPSFRARARGVQRSMLALPPLSRITDDLTGLFG